MKNTVCNFFIALTNCILVLKCVTNLLLLFEGCSRKILRNEVNKQTNNHQINTIIKRSYEKLIHQKYKDGVEVCLTI